MYAKHIPTTSETERKVVSRLVTELTKFRRETTTPKWLVKLDGSRKVLDTAERLAKMTGVTFESVLEEYHITEVGTPS